MASRESQGLQVALILFVMITVVLAVTTYVYFRKSEEKIRQAQTAMAQAKQAEQTAMAMQFQLQLLKHMLGFERKTDAELDSIKAGLGGDPEMQKILDAYEQDMAMYGAGFAGQDLSYRSLPEHLISTINARNKSLADADMIQKNLEKDRDSRLQAEAARADKAEQELQVAQNDLAQERQTFNQQRATMTTQSQQVASILPARQKEFEQTTGQLQNTIAEQRQNLTNVMTLNETLRAEKLRREDRSNELPDGEVTLVNTSARIVWINLGSADGLKRQMTFSVIDQQAAGVSEEAMKGTIEVTRVDEPHRAEARIVQDILNDPIMQGDKIYSPSFRRGQKTRFALAGLLDINGDGKSDRDKVKSVIALNGGVVDAELLDDGSIAGEVSAATRYLVQGERPDERTESKVLEGFTRMTEEATKYGVESISVGKLMDLMGYVPDNPVVPLTRGGSGGESNSQEFRPRTPRSSAY
jgi:hypothetical protein